MKHFFGWQAIGFLVVAGIVGSKRPSIAGRVLVAYLVLSSAALLAFSQDAAGVAKFTFLLLWMACATRNAGSNPPGRAERYATYGIAAGPATPPWCRCASSLGISNGITRWNAARAGNCDRPARRCFSGCGTRKASISRPFPDPRVLIAVPTTKRL